MNRRRPPTPAAADLPLVSVVVPVHRVEELLRRCLDSLLAQTYPRVELVVVDDGSPDGCPAIIDAYAAAHPGRVRALHQANQGVGPARNAGLEAARGEFVGFVDSDDLVGPRFVEDMVRRCLAADADACVSPFVVRFPSGWRVPFPFLTVRRRLSGEAAARLCLDQLAFTTFAWNKLYRRALFLDTGIRFPAMYYEDMAVVPRLLAAADRVAVSHRGRYRYCLRKDSATGAFDTDNLRDYLRAVGMVRTFMWHSGRWERWRPAYRRFLVHSRAHLLATLLLSPGLPPRERLRRARDASAALRRLRRPPGGNWPETFPRSGGLP